jgi:hypothetical protein
MYKKKLKKREVEIKMYSPCSQMIISINFLCYVLLFIIFKILIQICKIISCISILFSN